MAINTVVLVFGTAVLLFLLFFAFKALKKKRLVDDTPTSKAHGVFIGLVEVSGKVECPSPLRSYLTESECVYYRWNVSEHWSKTVTETYTDSQGKTKTRTRTESGWKTIASDEQMSHFMLRDESGAIQVRPEDSKVDGECILNYYCGPSDPMYYGKGPAGSIMNSDYRRCFTETIIPNGSTLYVMGQAREREDKVAAEIAYDREAPVFLISMRDEKKVSRSYGFNYWLLALGGLAVAFFTVFISNRTGYGWIPFSYMNQIIAAGLYLVAWTIGWFWTVFNALKSLRERTRQGKSQIEVQLKRRKDLVPSLVSTVLGLMRHEQGVQEALASLRSEAYNGFEGVGGRLLALIEKYPSLKSSEVVLKLQKELADTETRIELSRAYYNDIVTFYNTRLERIPDVLVAKIARLTPQGLFKN
ncbi:MAG: LemA family protein [Thermotogota bacterium]|nr:LemA family protein [Thermotogota bacterium]